MTNRFDKYTKLVKVVFADPADYDSRFSDKFEPVKCCVIGWLVKETKDCLRLAWLLDEEDGPSAGIAIPKGSVLSVQSLSDVHDSSCQGQAHTSTQKEDKTIPRSFSQSNCRFVADNHQMEGNV